MRSTLEIGARAYPWATHPSSGSAAPELGERYLILLRYVYYAFVFSVPYDAVTVQYISGGGVTLSKLLGYLLVLTTLAQPRSCYSRYPKPLPYFIGYILVYAALPAAQGFPPMSLLGGALRLVQMLVLFWISFSLMLSQRVVTGTLWTLAASCTTLAVLQALGLTSETVAQERVTMMGENPNNVAAVLSVGVLAFAGLAYGRTKTSRMGRALFVLCPTILVVQIIRTGSRGAAVALAAGLLAFVFRKDRRAGSKFKLALVVAALLGVLVVLSMQYEAVRLRWMNTIQHGNIAGRERIYSSAWNLFLERPWTGWGPGRHIVELGQRLGLRERDPHNLYLWILNETGILGGFFFFAALWRSWRSAWNARRGLQGVLPLALLVFVLAIDFKGTYHQQKFFWLVLAYVSSSAAYPHLTKRIRNRAIRPGFGQYPLPQLLPR